MTDQCSRLVFSGTWGGHQCSRRAVTVEDDKPVCRQHTAAAKAERLAAGEAAFQARLATMAAPFKRLRELEATNARLLAALEYYADPEHWQDDDWGCRSVIVGRDYSDGGATARAAIRQAKERS